MSLIYTSFPTVNLAERAIGALLDHGVLKEDISVVADENYKVDNGKAIDIDKVESSGKTGVTTTTGADAASGAAKGAGVGAVVGILGALAALTIPGFGLVMGGGALATAVASAAGTAVGGAIAGGVTGFLDDQGVPKAATQKYEEALKSGGAVLSVNLPSGKVDEIAGRELLVKYQGQNFVHNNQIVDAQTFQPVVVGDAIPSTGARVY